MATQPFEALTAVLERRIGAATSRAVVDAVTKALGPDFDPRAAGASTRVCRELFPLLTVFVEPRDVAVLENEVRALCKRWHSSKSAKSATITQAAVLEVLVRYVPRTMARSVLDSAWRKHAPGDVGGEAADRLVGEIMESLRVFCAQEQLASLMVDLAELCLEPPDE